MVTMARFLVALREHTHITSRPVVKNTQYYNQHIIICINDRSDEMFDEMLL